MSADINYQNNPLHGVSLKQMLVEVVDQYGFDLLFAYLNINCFKTNPSIESSVKFLKKTTWAREKVESFYLYQYKNLPRASDEQFALPPRDRIVPADQLPGEPAQLSLEAAERLAEKRLRKSAERSQVAADRSGADRHRANPRGGRSTGHRNSGSFGTDETDRPTAPGTSVTPAVDPWAKWRK